MVGCFSRVVRVSYCRILLSQDEGGFRGGMRWWVYVVTDKKGMGVAVDLNIKIRH